MALLSMSIDEILTMMADFFDGLIAPLKIFRNNNNKFWLAFRAIAAGYTTIIDAALVLHNRFDPRYCDDVDLYSTAKLVGTDFKEGSGSLLQITITNSSSTTEKTLPAGVYIYTATSGQPFSFELLIDLVLAASASQEVTAISADKGQFLVDTISSITLTRADNTAIDPTFVFSTVSNAGQLGYPDESPWDFRNRILTDPNRQDHIAELELAIRNLPNIFECNIVFNQTPDVATYDGIDLDPYQMLIIITGEPTDDIAFEVVKQVIYHTKMVDPDLVVYYFNDRYIDGQYPVYYKFHDTTDFQLEIKYQFDSQKIHAEKAEQLMNAILDVYRDAVQHIDILTEDDVYTLLKGTPINSVKILNVNILVDAVEQEYLSILKSRLPNLTDVTFTGIDLSA